MINRILNFIIMDETTKLKWFKKIYFWAYQNCKKTYLHIHKNDMVCPNCKEWFSITSLKKENTRTGIDLKNMKDCEKIVCGQCDYTSYWVWGIIPAYSRVDKQGNVID